LNKPAFISNPLKNLVGAVKMQQNDAKPVGGLLGAIKRAEKEKSDKEKVSQTPSSNKKNAADLYK